MILRRRFRIL